jgi:cysteine desulfurase
MAMGCSIERARGSIRLSLGIYNTEQEVDHVLKELPEIISRLRGEASKGKKHPAAAAAALVEE